MHKVIISTTTFGEFDPSPLHLLEKAGLWFALNPYKRKLTSAEVITLAQDAAGIVAGTESLTADVLKQLKNLKVISRCGAGIDNVDLETAKKLGIAVFSTPYGPTRAVAELTVGLMLDCLRGISQSDRGIRRGEWQKPMGWLLEGKTVGIVGFGRIGKTVCRLLQPWGVKVIAHDIITPPDNLGAAIVSFEHLIANSDIITLHTHADAGCIINKESIAQMKDGAIVINTSRGNLVNEDALSEAIASRKLAGAGIDTPPEEPYKGKLKDLENIVITSHIGSYAKEARVLMEKQAVENLLAGLKLFQT